MLDFPNAKVNLGLNITAKRPDGYHEIETCFLPVPWKDALEIVEAPKFSFTSSGLNIPGDGSDNLCVKAYKIIASSYSIPPVHIHLHKIIPMGAGLGGGSADCAWTIRLLNEMFELGMSHEKMAEIAGKLGSDCPFFIWNKPLLAKGVGNVFEEIKIDLSGNYIALNYPNIHVSTIEAYSGVSPAIPTQSLKNILKNPANWKDSLINQFEAKILKDHPEIAYAKNKLYEQGAWYAAMSGSGSTVFGLFSKKPVGAFDFVGAL
ncbi:MAG: 4-(cytidine 5'-diphospho)-2-C-methyl-D-erythritol kinase [Cyclobacteriaceae bacterium]